MKLYTLYLSPDKRNTMNNKIICEIKPKKYIKKSIVILLTVYAKLDCMSRLYYF